MNIFKKVYNWFYKDMPPTRTTQEIVTILNNQTPGETWEPIDGVQSLTTVTRQAPSGVSFNVGSGVLIKGFINRATGEIRLFPAKLFGYPEIDT